MSSSKACECTTGVRFLWTSKMQGSSQGLEGAITSISVASELSDTEQNGRSSVVTRTCCHCQMPFITVRNSSTLTEALRDLHMMHHYRKVWGHRTIPPTKKAINPSRESLRPCGTMCALGETGWSTNTGVRSPLGKGLDEYFDKRRIIANAAKSNISGPKCDDLDGIGAPAPRHSCNSLSI